MFLPKLPSYFYQFLGSLIGDLQILSYGIMFGITSSALIYYQSDQTPLIRPMTEDEASWVTTYLCLGATIGTAVFGGFADRLGRKMMLLWSGLCHIAGWGSLLFGYEVWHIFLSRFLVGAGSGGAYILLPIYVAEISEDNYRGSLGLYISTFRSLGILIGFLFGAYLDYNIIPYLGGATAVIFALAFPFIPESPYFYVIKKDIPRIEKSLQWFRGIRNSEDRSKEAFIKEVEKFRSMVNASNEIENTKSRQTKLFSCFMFKLVMIGFVVVTATQLCGVFAILNYADVIFTDVSSGFSANDSGIIMAVATCISTYIGALLADRFNRKLLICSTSFGAGVFLTTFGITVYLQEIGIEFGNYKWIPLLCICLHIILVNIGLYPLSFVVIAEIFPQDIKGPITTFFMTYIWGLSIFIIKYYYLLVEAIGIYGCMWVFSSYCLFECFIVMFFVPETRGKSFGEIQTLLGGGKAAIPE